MCQNKFNFFRFAAELDIRKDPCDKFKAAISESMLNLSIRNKWRR